MLIFPHEAAIALDIGTEDGSGLTFKVLRDHGVPSRDSVKKPKSYHSSLGDLPYAVTSIAVLDEGVNRNYRVKRKAKQVLPNLLS